MEIEAILSNIKNGDWWTRKEAIDRLLSYPGDSYLSVLKEWLRDGDDALVRNAAIETFTALGDRAFNALFSLAGDEDADVRLFVANILGEIKEPASIPVLQSSLNDPDPNVRIASAEALGKIGDRQALGALQKLLDDEVWVVMSALQAIGDIGGEDALNILYECLKNEDTRDFAITAIEKAGNKQSIQYLAQFISKTDHSFHRDLALDAIIKIAEKEKVRLKPENFINLVPILIEKLDSEDPDMKRPAFIALCWSEDITGLPYFLRAIRDEELQEYAIDGLLNIGRRAAPAIIAEMNNSEGSHRQILAKVLSMLGEHNALIQFKKDENPEVRIEVALALGSVNSATSVRALLKMLADPYEEVRLSARKSLDLLHGGKGVQ